MDLKWIWKVVWKSAIIALIVLVALTIFGPWATYRSYGNSYTLGQTVYINDVPVWLGELCGWESQVESDEKNLKYAKNQIKKYEGLRAEDNSEQIDFIIDIYEEDIRRIEKR